MPTTNKGFSTIGTKLFYSSYNGDLDPNESGVISAGTTAQSQLCHIKSYPDLMGTPEMIEVTDLEDTVQKFVVGVQSQDSLEFTANYTPDEFNTVYTNSTSKDGNQDAYYAYRLLFNNGSSNTIIGQFYWIGQHAVRVTGSGVNEAREMAITCIPTSMIAWQTSASSNNNNPPG